MKNKLMASALVLGFTIAPAAAFASVTTTQGGTPVYICPPGQQLVDTDKCLIPATSTTEEFRTDPTITSELIPIESMGNYNCTSYIDSWARNNLVIRELGTQCQPGYSEWIGWYKHNPSNFETVNTYSCPDTYTLFNNDCVRTVVTPVPAQTTAATIAGSNGGSVIASVTGFLSPVWDFIQTKLLPAIAALVVLGIGVRLSIKAVRKYSKVA